MKAIIISVIVMLSLPACLVAQKPDSLLANSLLWQVSGNGLTKPSYLLGTIHVICVEDAFLDGITEKKLAAADKLFLEVNDTSSVRQYFRMKNKTIPDLIDEEHVTKVKKMLPHHKSAEYDSLFRFIPYFVTGQLMGELGFEWCRHTSMERVVTRYARQKRIPVFELESSREHMVPIASLSLETQVAQLKDVIDNPSFYKKRSEYIRRFYQKKNIEELYRQVAIVIADAEKGQPVLFLDNRNKSWIQVMGNAMKTSSCFFAFGAAHLAGLNGVINLLRQKGYSVAPLQNIDE
jgi:uncharacterized protein YbaP (TraB family)